MNVNTSRPQRSMPNPANADEEAGPIEGSVDGAPVAAGADAAGVADIAELAPLAAL